MDEIEIEAELLDIQSLHESLDIMNPMTYAILLERCKDKLNEEQIKYIQGEIERLRIRERKIIEKWINKFGEVS